MNGPSKNSNRVRATSARIVGRAEAPRSYDDFLRAKMALAPNAGVACGPINGILKPHQADIVRWAVEGGRRAIFCSFGLGKSVMQLEVLRLTLLGASGADQHPRLDAPDAPKAWASEGARSMP